MRHSRIFILLILKILIRCIILTFLEWLCGCLKDKKISTWKVHGCQIVVDMLYVSSIASSRNLAMRHCRIFILLIFKILKRCIVSAFLEWLCGCLKHKKIFTWKVRGCQIVVDILYVSSIASSRDKQFSIVAFSYFWSWKFLTGASFWLF